MKKFFFAWIFFYTTATNAAVDVYRCDSNGKQIFSQVPCKETTVEVLEITDSDKKHENERMLSKKKQEAEKEAEYLKAEEIQRNRLLSKLRGADREAYKLQILQEERLKLRSRDF